MNLGGFSRLEATRMYPEIMVIPMREELVRAGIEEARSAEEVDAALARPGTTMLVVNSICGCAAGKMRPGVRMALGATQNAPDYKITVFAGQDREATEKARGYFEGNPPTSPAIANEPLSIPGQSAKSLRTVIKCFRQLSSEWPPPGMRWCRPNK